MLTLETLSPVTIFCFHDLTMPTLISWRETILQLYEDCQHAPQPFLTLYDFRPILCPTSRSMEYMVKFAKENPHGLPRATAILTAAHTLGIVEMTVRRMPKHEMVRVFLEEHRAYEWLEQFV